jgi:hypothetical protein
MLLKAIDIPPSPERWNQRELSIMIGVFFPQSQSFHEKMVRSSEITELDDGREELEARILL